MVVVLVINKKMENFIVRELFLNIVDSINVIVVIIKVVMDLERYVVVKCFIMFCLMICLFL